MFVLVLAAEAEETRQTVALLIVGLIGVAVALAVLTVWYWFFTDPKRQPGLSARRVALGTVERTADADRMASFEPVPEIGGAGEADPLRAVAEVDGPVLTASGRLDEVDRSDEVDGGDETDGSGGIDQPAAAPTLARQTLDYVAAARRAEERPVIRPPERPAAPRILVGSRGGVPGDDAEGDDELAVARRRREREMARGLSDETWDSVRRSVFNKLDG